MFHWIDVRAFCHATEDEEKVLAAIRTVMPTAEVERKTLAGHFGNPLVVLTAKVESAAEVKAVWSRLAAALGPAAIVDGLEERLDEDGVYHVRLDKQKACGGVLETTASADAIVLRAKVAAFPRRREIALDIVRTAAGAA